MKLLAKKKLDYEKILSDEKIERDIKINKRDLLKSSIFGIASLIYLKYDNIIINNELSISQQILDNFALMLTKIGTEPIISLIMLTPAIGFLVSYISFKYSIKAKQKVKLNQNKGDFQIVKKSKITFAKLKSQLLNCGFLTFAGLGYLATTKNISFDISSNNALTILMENTYWAVDGAINEPIILTMFMMPAIILKYASDKYAVKYRAMKYQNGLLMQREKAEEDICLPITVVNCETETEKNKEV